MCCFLVGCGSGNSSDNEMNFEQLKWPTHENAKQIPVPKSTLADVKNSNSVRFEFYLANTTFEDYKAYIEECKSMGFTVEPIEQEYRYYAFNEAKYELDIQYKDGDIMYVSVVEERFDIDIKLLHTDKASADMYNLRIEIDDMWEEDSEQGDEAITFDANLKEGTHTLTIANDDDEDINGRVNFTVSENGEYFEFEIECLSNKISISPISDHKTDTSTTIPHEVNEQSTTKGTSEEIITLSEAKAVFEEVFNQYKVLVDDLSELIDYCNETTFNSIDEIHEFEEQWIDLSDTAYELANNLVTKIPPEKCKTEWEKFADKLMKIGSILYGASTIDANLDNKYDVDEMEKVINNACDDFVAVGEEIIDIATKFNEIVGGIDSTITNNNTPSNSKKCEECGKTATKTVDLFGQTEYYCTTHYNEIMDILDMMESDVGAGTASKHTCEECSNEGTHSMIGISGKTEYYCTKHYNELKEFLEIFQ